MNAREKYEYVHSLARWMRNAEHFVWDDRYHEAWQPEEYEMPLHKLTALTGIEVEFYEENTYTWHNEERYWRFKELTEIKWVYYIADRKLESPIETISRWIELCEKVDK